MASTGRLNPFTVTLFRVTSPLRVEATGGINPPLPVEATGGVNPPLRLPRKWLNGMRKAPPGPREPGSGFRSPKTGPGRTRRAASATRFMLPELSGQRVRVLRIFFNPLPVLQRKQRNVEEAEEKELRRPLELAVGKGESTQIGYRSAGKEGIRKDCPRRGALEGRPGK